VEDNPEHGWEEYADKYKKTLTAALFWPDVDHYEVCPWPNRVFKGRYPRKVGLAEGMIPPMMFHLIRVCPLVHTAIC